MSNNTPATPAAPAFDAATDSSKANRAAARLDGRLHLNLGAAGIDCLCGCNGTAERRFLPGHDAKLKGILTRAALRNAKIALHVGDAIVETTPRAFAAKLTTPKHDWALALDKAVETARKAAAAAKANAAKADAKKAAAKAARPSGKLDLAALGFTAA